MAMHSTQSASLILFSGLFILFASLLLVGCSDTPADPKVLEARSKNLVPLDPRLAEIYERSCRTCHVSNETGAPLTGDRRAWEERLEQGMPTLVRHVVEGFGGMPPYGMCMECQREDFNALIQFMATASENP